MIILKTLYILALHLEDLGPKIQIKYSQPSLVNLKLNDSEERVYLMEDYQEGLFMKLTNNDFFIPIINYNMEEKYIIDFSHWSYAWTNSSLMVTDLQGWAMSKSSFILTDPAIHSRSKQFGKTDQGETGFNRYFIMHRDVCIIDRKKIFLFIFY